MLQKTYDFELSILFLFIVGNAVNKSFAYHFDCDFYWLVFGLTWIRVFAFVNFCSSSLAKKIFLV